MCQKDEFLWGCGPAEDSCEFKQDTKRNQRFDNHRSLPCLILGKQCTLFLNVFGKRKHTFFLSLFGPVWHFNSWAFYQPHIKLLENIRNVTNRLSQLSASYVLYGSNTCVKYFTHLLCFWSRRKESTNPSPPPPHHHHLVLISNLNLAAPVWLK